MVVCTKLINLPERHLCSCSFSGEACFLSVVDGSRGSRLQVSMRSGTNCGTTRIKDDRELEVDDWHLMVDA